MFKMLSPSTFLDSRAGSVRYPNLSQCWVSTNLPCFMTIYCQLASRYFIFCCSLDDSFEQRIAHELAALDDIPSTGSEMIRHSDHVSCEDLLEFACDAPNARRTQGKARGVDSDEVRIMGKVLGPEVTIRLLFALQQIQGLGKNVSHEI